MNNQTCTKYSPWPTEVTTDSLDAAADGDRSEPMDGSSPAGKPRQPGLLVSHCQLHKEYNKVRLKQICRKDKGSVLKSQAADDTWEPLTSPQHTNTVPAHRASLWTPAWTPARGRELDLMILMDPFQCEILHDYSKCPRFLSTNLSTEG